MRITISYNSKKAAVVIRLTSNIIDSTHALNVSNDLIMKLFVKIIDLLSMNQERSG